MQYSIQLFPMTGTDNSYLIYILKCYQNQSAIRVFINVLILCGMIIYFTITCLTFDSGHQDLGTKNKHTHTHTHTHTQDVSIP